MRARGESKTSETIYKYHILFYYQLFDIYINIKNTLNLSIFFCHPVTEKFIIISICFWIYLNFQIMGRSEGHLIKYVIHHNFCQRDQ